MILATTFWINFPMYHQTVNKVPKNVIQPCNMTVKKHLISLSKFYLNPEFLAE